MNTTLAVLEEVAEFLEDQSDVRDGDDGRPLPNKAMSLLQIVQWQIEDLKREDLKRAALTATKRDG